MRSSVGVRVSCEVSCFVIMKRMYDHHHHHAFVIARLRALFELQYHVIHAIHSTDVLQTDDACVL